MDKELIFKIKEIEGKQNYNKVMHILCFLF